MGKQVGTKHIVFFESHKKIKNFVVKIDRVYLRTSFGGWVVDWSEGFLAGE